MADRADEFRERMALLIEEYRDILAPVRCALCSDDDHCPHERNDDNAQPIPDVVNTEWLLIHAWTSFAKPGGYWDWNTNASMSMTAAVGLLAATQQDALRNL